VADAVIEAENPHFHRHKDGSFPIATPKAPAEESEPLHRLLPHHHYISEAIRKHDLAKE